MEIIGVGDLHLDKLSKIFPDDHADVVIREFNKVIKHARDHSIKYIVQYGDACETPFMSRESRRALYRVLSENNDIKFIFILGNHDWGEEGIHSLDELSLLCDLGKFDNVKVVTKSTVISIEGVPLHLMPYPVRK